MSDNRPNIWRLQALADTQGLIKALEHSDPDIRERAAIALRTLSAFDAIPAMRTVLTTEANPDTRTIITSALVHLLEEQQEEAESDKPTSPPDETALLIGQLKSTEHNDIVHAAQALGALGDPLAVEPLVMLFNNGALPANVRLAAAEALIELKSPPTIVTALVALRRPDAHLRRIAAAMLGHLEADWAIEPLRAALKDENELVRRTARAALKHINTPEAHQAIESVPEHEPAAITQTSKAVQPTVEQPPPQVTVTEVVAVEIKPDERAAISTSSGELSVPQPAAEGAPLAASLETKSSETVEQPTPAKKAAPPTEAPEVEPAEATALSSEIAAETATPVESSESKVDALDKAVPAAEAAPPAPALQETPESQPKPEWSLEQTRPSRPEGLDEALRAQNADVVESVSAQTPTSTPTTPAPSSDGASTPNTPQTNA